MSVELQNIPASAELINIAAPNDFEPPFPFNALDLWGNISKITASPRENINRDHVEYIFGLKMHAIKMDWIPGAPVQMVALAPVDWYYDIILMPSEVDKNGSSMTFLFQWGQKKGRFSAFPEPVGGICVRPDMMLSSMNSQGWVVVYHGVTGLDKMIMPYQYRLKLDYHEAIADFTSGGGCLISFTIR
ncbi:hypothetical protein [Nitrospirillum iridis]|uniref:Uncharacterized protein n=1 Tax=Nitrospirillum iridis TaxID=765888 RepID=A0A7X0AZH5_9PROT|nr:hypothetical protein [Nitrospirillum iridis]MBB6251890.1 hypothetical protein [Nitrospirillum iridis]